MSIDDALNTLARKFSTFDDLKEMGNYYIKECKQTLLEIIIREKPKKKCTHTVSGKYERGYACNDCKMYNQGADEYEAKLRELFG